MTYAALILLGKREALGRHLAQAEVIFEYRSNEAPGPAADRHEFRQGFLPVLDEIWRLVNLRTTCSTSSRGSLSGMCLPSASAWFEKLSSTQ